MSSFFLGVEEVHDLGQAEVESCITKEHGASQGPPGDSSFWGGHWGRWGGSLRGDQLQRG